MLVTGSFEEDLSGRVVSHYRIVGKIGSGGMGVVYRAEDDRLGRAVALKFFSSHSFGDADALERFRLHDASPRAQAGHPSMELMAGRLDNPHHGEYVLQR